MSQLEVKAAPPSSFLFLFSYDRVLRESSYLSADSDESSPSDHPPPHLNHISITIMILLLASDVITPTCERGGPRQGGAFTVQAECHQCAEYER